MPTITIRVGAALDSSMLTVLRPFEATVRRARVVVAAEMKGAGDSMAKEAARGASRATAAVNAMTADEVKALQRTAAAAMAASQKKTRAALADFDARLRASRKAAAAEEADILRVAAAAEKAAQRRAAADARAARAQREHLARDFGYRSVANIGGTFRRGMGIAGEFARGAGVDFSIASIVGKNIDLRKQATELSNAGFNTGVTGSDKRVDPAKIVAAVKEAADAVSGDRGATAAGLSAFVGKTGDLATGMATIGELGRLSKATGTDMGDMVDAAGDVANALNDIQDPAQKAEKVQQIMRTIAAQGKMGAVEIKQLAVQMAKLGSAAGAFEGDAAENVALMGAFAQMSRAKGGSASATQAATSVAAMVNTLKTPARIAAFKREGIDVMNDQGMIRNPRELLIGALGATGGDPERMKKMYANVQGARAVDGFATIFRQAKGDAVAKGAPEKAAIEAGIAAVRKEFDRLTSASMGKGEIADSLAARLKDDDSKAQAFNNKLQDIGEKAAQKLLPALEQLAPAILRAVDGFSKVATWAAENPGKAITAAIVASIAKAGMETTIRGATEALMRRALEGKAGSAVGGGMGALGAGLTIAALAVGTATIGMMVIDAASDDRSRGENRAGDAAAQRVNAMLDFNAKTRAGTVTNEDRAALLRERDALDKTIAAAQDPTSNAGQIAAYGGNTLGAAMLGGLPGLFLGELLGNDTKGQKAAEDSANAKMLEQLKADRSAMTRSLQAMFGQTMNVHIVGGLPPVDSGARTGP